MNQAICKHAAGVLEIKQHYFQALCQCGWSSTISYFEEVDLLRAMHAHAVVSFQNYQQDKMSVISSIFEAKIMREGDRNRQ